MATDDCCNFDPLGWMSKNINLDFNPFDDKDTERYSIVPGVIFLGFMLMRWKISAGKTAPA